MKTTIAEFIAPYIETYAHKNCLIGTTQSSCIKSEYYFYLIETVYLNNIYSNPHDESNIRGFQITALDDTEAQIDAYYHEYEWVELTDELSIYVRPSKLNDWTVICSLDLKTVEAKTNY